VLLLVAKCVTQVLLAGCRLEAASLPDKVAVTNGGSSKQRLMLRNAAVQLLDSYGNPAGGGGVQVGVWVRASEAGSWLGLCHAGHGM